MKKVILLIILLLGTNVVEAAEASQSTSITRFISYNKFGGGDVVFRIANPTANCFGYWISKGDAGFSTNLSLILAAYQTKTKVKVTGLTDQKWPGSSSFWCKLYAIEYPE
jgi:hypothetical protein